MSHRLSSRWPVLLALLLTVIALLLSVQIVSDEASNSRSDSLTMAERSAWSHFRHSRTNGPRQGKSGHTKPKRDPRTVISKIRSHYPNLGFVTLSSGENRNIVKGDQLEIVRDHAVIARLKVSVVESETAAADVIPHSTIGDLKIRSGDLVRPLE